MLYLYNIIKSTTALGKGKRFAIWTQGCNKKCKNCFTPDAQPQNKNGDYFSIDNLVDIIKAMNISGLTITGGEPFLQAKKLSILIKKLRKIKTHLEQA